MQKGAHLISVNPTPICIEWRLVPTIKQPWMIDKTAVYTKVVYLKKSKINTSMRTRLSPLHFHSSWGCWTEHRPGRW